MSRKLILTLLALALILAACAPLQPALPPAPVIEAAPATETAAPPATIAPLTFVDGLGRTVTLTGTAQRIVSLAPSNTEILFAIGAGAQVVGRDEFSDYPAEAAALPTVGGSFGGYNLEQIVALEPDLVLAAEINTPEQVKALEDLGLTVYYLKNPTTLEEMFATLKMAALFTGHEAEAEALVQALQARVQTVDEKLASVTEKPVVFYEIDATDPNKPFSAGPGTFIDLLITRAGGINLTRVAGITDAYPQVGLEQIVSVDPQVILLGDAMWGVTVESVAARPGWDGLTAVKEGRVLPFDDNLVSRPGPRLVDGLEALAKLLHPNAFK